MTTHRWELQSTDWTGGGTVTRYEWECSGCHCRTFTNSSGHTGSRTAEAFRPGRRALQATRVDPDCTTAMVDAVHDL